MCDFYDTFSNWYHWILDWNKCMLCHVVPDMWYLIHIYEGKLFNGLTPVKRTDQHTDGGGGDIISTFILTSLTRPDQVFDKIVIIALLRSTHIFLLYKSNFYQNRDILGSFDVIGQCLILDRRRLILNATNTIICYLNKNGAINQIGHVNTIEQPHIIVYL
jgi:hypothetical protein